MKNTKKLLKVLEKSWTQEFNKYKKKLNKIQLKKLNKYQKKEMNKINSMINAFDPLISATIGLRIKSLKKSDPYAKYICIAYIKYTLLKIKRPTYSKATGSPDPYNCGPDYFRPQCCNSGYYYDWSNDRR